MDLRSLAGLLAAVVLVAEPPPVMGHASGLAALHVTREGQGWVVEARLPGADLITALGGTMEPGGDPRPHLERLAPDVESYVSGHLLVIAGGTPLAAGSVRLSGGDAARAWVQLRYPSAPGPLEIRCRLFVELDPAYRSIITWRSPDGSLQQVVVQAGGAPVRLGGTGGDRGSGSLSLGQYVSLGIEHIFTGYDHLMFLLGLLLLAASLRPLIITVTFFTVAHSITLGAAAVDLLVLPPTVVEPAIAFSICYVAVENFFVTSLGHRWALTFGFGLIHGFGFAGVLKEVGLPRDSLVPSLLGFNAGVELGQLAIVAMAFPVLRFLAARSWYRSVGVPVASLAVLFFGLDWLLERLFG